MLDFMTQIGEVPFDMGKLDPNNYDLNGEATVDEKYDGLNDRPCLLYTSPSPRDS